MQNKLKLAVIALCYAPAVFAQTDSLATQPTTISESAFTLTEAQLGEDEDMSQSVTIINSSSNIYANEVGYLFSPVRFRYRAFDQKFNDVYINGVPMNDMESGQFRFTTIGGLNQQTRNVEFALPFESNNFAMAIAPSVGIWLHDAVGSYMVLFWIALAVAGSSVVIAGTLKLPEKEIIKNKDKLSLDRFFLTRAWLLAINIAMFGFCWGVLSNYLAIYSKEALGITGGTGTYFAILSCGLFLSRLQGRKALRDGRLTQNAMEGMCLSLVGFILFVAVPHPVAYYLSAALIGLGNGHLYPAFLNMFVAVARHDQRGTANSSILTGWDLGFGIGCLLGGVVAEHWGYGAAFWMVALENACGVAIFFMAGRKFFMARKRSE